MDSRAPTLAEGRGADRTPSPSPIPSINKEKTQFGDQPTDTEGSIHEKPSDNVATTIVDDIEYPSGLRLAAIVIALLLSIFLVRDPNSHFQTPCHDRMQCGSESIPKYCSELASLPGTN